MKNELVDRSGQGVGGDDVDALVQAGADVIFDQIRAFIGGQQLAIEETAALTDESQRRFRRQAERRRRKRHQEELRELQEDIRDAYARAKALADQPDAGAGEYFAIRGELTAARGDMVSHLRLTNPDITEAQISAVFADVDRWLADNDPQHQAVLAIGSDDGLTKVGKVRRLLEVNPALSDAELAEETGASERTIAAARKPESSEAAT